MESIYRIQLSYDKLDNTVIDSIRYSKPVAGGESEDQPLFTNIKTISAYESDAYSPDPDSAHFLYETGELILGKSIYEEFRTADDIELTYRKSNFDKGDLKPEHYFDCSVKDLNRPDEPEIEYTKVKQEIRYEINYNQMLTINTEASDVISHKIGRDIDDILNSVNDVIKTEEKIQEIKKRLDDPNISGDDASRYDKMLEQLDTELVLKKEIMQAAFSRGISSSENEQNRVNIGVSDLGSRYFRLELTENRLASQKTEFKELLSKNEDVDLVNTIINFNSAYMIYNASLSASSKVVQNSLLDFL
jgi:flagellar hook-associated protein 3 FlgL